MQLTTLHRRLTAAALAWSLVQAGASAQDVDTDEGAVEVTRSVIEKYVEVRAQIAAEKRDWTVGKEVLADRIEVLRNEIESFRARIDEARDSIATVDVELDELREAYDALAAASSVAEERIVADEQRTLALLDRMPAPLLEKVDLIRQRFPDDPENTKQPLSQRYVTIAGVLNEINKFNAEITTAPELRELANGETAEVTVIYVGLGHAYYVSADGRWAGVGVPGPDGWQWSARADASAQIDMAAKILSGEEIASFVTLPLSVQ